KPGCFVVFKTKFARGHISPSFAQKKVTVQQHHIFGRSARLTYTKYAAPVRLSKSVPLLNGYSPAVVVL
ncbi:MAG: hypothetical protein LC633_04915, partial [Desulfobulbaceae bacterium]|nr:hypothetical protein [Desulfobulbaceae bacterium]